jgi:hypothetical protein
VHDTYEFETILEEGLETLCNYRMVVREENSRPWHARLLTLTISYRAGGASQMHFPVFDYPAYLRTPRDR